MSSLLSGRYSAVKVRKILYVTTTRVAQREIDIEFVVYTEKPLGKLTKRLESSAKRRTLNKRSGYTGYRRATTDT